MTTQLPPIVPPSMSVTDFNMMKLGEIIAVLVKSLESTTTAIFQIAELAQVVEDEGVNITPDLTKLFFERLRDLSATSHNVLDGARNLTTPLLAILEVDPNNLSTLSNQ